MAHGTPFIAAQAVFCDTDIAHVMMTHFRGGLDAQRDVLL